MKNEEKILEMLSEVLQKVDRIDDTQKGHGAKLDRLETNQQTLISAVARHNTALRVIADDIQEIKGLKISVDELERRVDELERYTGKK